MNLKQHMIIDNQTGKIITPDIVSCKYNANTKRYDVLFKSGKSFPYGYNRITWLKNPKTLDHTLYRISHSGTELFDIDSICVFSDRFWHISFKNGSERDYRKKDLKITKSCLNDCESKSVFSYLKKIADLSNLKTDDGTKLLTKYYEKISSFVDQNTALAAYLNPKNFKSKNRTKTVPIFPFGCNSSQYNAVKSALENQISVIQGPPGTGKTQTILNIIANLLVSNQTIQIVSNNESAITNISEKLSSPKYAMGFLAALLGKSDNKKEFLKNQTENYPDLSEWCLDSDAARDLADTIHELSLKLNDIYQKQEQLALTKQELQMLKTEQEHFKQYIIETSGKITLYKIRRKLKSDTLLQLWQKCQHFSDTDKNLTFWFKIKSYIMYGISDWNFYKIDISKVINMFQALYYKTKAEELSEKIGDLERELKSHDAKDLTDKLTDTSMKYLKSIIYNKYGQKASRHIFTESDLREKPHTVQNEYPIILSTTFSSKNSLSNEAVFDYLIMDEASQVDIATGALALSCAKNAVIVGDTKQLPNIVSGETKNISDAVFESFNINEGYRFSQNSFLQSVCKVFPAVPQTLLREHYRCHPKIINFCNQKFYNGKLVIMTPDNGEKDVISVIKTVAGDHERDKMNRRQIDSVVHEILPKLDCPPSEIGIIAPYNNQVDALKMALKETEIDIATVHKFQGREKDAIILTTVDDEISEFTDDPYLLNVAVSRAKKKLYLVISGYEQPKDSNINDLVAYIQYNNFDITQSKLYSIFDYLYKQYTQSRIEFLKKYKKISEYDSENLMYGLIKKTLKEYQLSYLDVVCHMPLNMLIHDPTLLNDEECRYAMNNSTHLDFIIYNRISKAPVLAVEVDGYHYHKDTTVQAKRDKMKNHILDLYEIPYLRFATNGSSEKEILTKKLYELIQT